MAMPDGISPLKAIHLLKLPATDRDRSLSSCEIAPRARHFVEADHRRADDGWPYARILDVPNLGAMRELRLDSVQARGRAGFGSSMLTVKDRAALGAWSAHLAAHGFLHLPAVVAIQACLTVVADPDDHRSRVDTLETRDPAVPHGENDPWPGT